MNNDDVGCIAFLSILGVVGAVAITKPGLNGQAGLNEGIVRWLLYAVACGLIANTQEGKPFKVILIAALASALTLISTIAFKLIMVGGVLLSGAVIDFESNATFATQLLVVLFVFSALAIIMSSYSRVIVLSLLDGLFNIELSKAKKIEAILNRVVSIGAISAVIIFSIL